MLETSNVLPQIEGDYDCMFWISSKKWYFVPKIVLVLVKNFLYSQLKAKNLQDL